MRVSGERILTRDLRLALDERKHVVDEFLFHACAVFLDPFDGNLLLVVGDSLERQEIVLADVRAGAHVSLESDHLSGLTVYSALDSDLARVEGLVYIGLGSGVGSASLEKAELYSSDLDADPVKVLE